MPLFHIHGLIAVLVSVWAGERLYVALQALRRLNLWIATTEQISWYSGVPTMHQAILLRAKRIGESTALACTIRSSSASLPPAVFEELVSVFDCPVIEAYGMTEAAHQMTSNPLEGRQKAGFVGVATFQRFVFLIMRGSLNRRGMRGSLHQGR